METSKENIDSLNMEEAYPTDHLQGANLRDYTIIEWVGTAGFPDQNVSK